jgi:hypothetical protein
MGFNSAFKGLNKTHNLYVLLNVIEDISINTRIYIGKLIYQTLFLISRIHPVLYLIQSKQRRISFEHTRIFLQNLHVSNSIIHHHACDDDVQYI